MLAHTRRNSTRWRKPTDTPIAIEALRRIADLYAVEAHARGQSPTKRLATRRARAKPIVDAFRALARGAASVLSGPGQSRRSDPVCAGALAGFDPVLARRPHRLDTNPVERAIRPVALGRKIISLPATTAAANDGPILCSLIETCKLDGVEPYAYLKDVLSAWSTDIRSTVSTNCCRGLGRVEDPVKP